MADIPNNQIAHELAMLLIKSEIANKEITEPELERKVANEYLTAYELIFEELGK